MFNNYIKIAWRSFLKNKKLFFINIIGLATGVACTLLIFLFVTDEFSYDRFHTDAENIHRVVKDFINDDGGRIPDATTPLPLGPAIQKEIPEVDHVTRIHPGWGQTILVKYKDKTINEGKIWRVDSSFFDVFTFSFIQGNPKTALKDVNSIILTEGAAKRYFGSEDPMGKILNLDNQHNLVVTGILEDIPTNSHFHFDFLLSLNRLPAQWFESWGSYNYYTYIKVKEKTDIKSLNSKIQDVYETHQSTRYSEFYTQPLTGIHLTSHLKWELEPNSDQLYVYAFSIIGLFILLIAAINYINLSTASSSLRAKEVGIRKVSGAEKSSLVRQFLLESIILCLISSLVAILVAQMLLPVVNELTGKGLSIIDNPAALLYMFITTILLGIIAGIFPALYLSSFKPVTILKEFKTNESGTLSLRKALVVVQFTISIVLIIGVIVISQQMAFIQSAKLGFDKDQVVVVKNANHLSESDRSAFLNSIKQLAGVKNAAAAASILGEGFSTSRLSPKGSDKEYQLNYKSVDFNYLDVMGMEVIEGRGFSPEFPADVMNNGIPGGPLEQTIGSIILNEQAVEEFGLERPVIGSLLKYGSDADTSYYLNVVGIVKDFHFTSLRNEIKPFGFMIIPNWYSNFTIKLSTDNIQATLAQLESKWKQTSSEYPFEYVFMDETFAKLYAAEDRFHKVFISLVILGIIIACLGLFGLATFAAERRIKEIGIRKVLGASVPNIIVLLSSDFLKLVFISLLLAVPISWYVMNEWLQDFSYRINIEWWVFILAGVLAIIIAFLTISSQAIKAALANPVKNLRTE